MADQQTKTIQKAIAGDRMAFRTLVLEHSHAMFRLAWRLTQDEHLAEDVVQEAFLKAYRKIEGFNLQASFGTWIHRITVNTAMDLLRKRSSRMRHETDDSEWVEADAPMPGGAAIDEREDIRRHTEAALQELTELERAAFTLRHFEGHSIAEICDILEMKDNACKQAIFRAVRKMRAALQPLVST